MGRAPAPAGSTADPADERITSWELALLPATWDNADEVLHRLWSQAARGVYRKREWAVLQRMLQQLRPVNSAEIDQPAEPPPIPRRLLRDFFPLWPR